jgi:hypothetical protein
MGSSVSGGLQLPIPARRLYCFALAIRRDAAATQKGRRSHRFLIAALQECGEQRSDETYLRALSADWGSSLNMRVLGAWGLLQHAHLNLDRPRSAKRNRALEFFALL